MTDENTGMEVVAVKLVSTGTLGKGERIRTPHDAVRIMGDMVKELDREVLCVINLKGDGTPIHCNIVSVGTINESPASPAMIIKSAILSNAPDIIVLHNHPSGNVRPSIEDRETTERLEYICKMTGIRMVDHIIIGGKLCYSFRSGETLLFQDYMSEPDKRKEKSNKQLTFLDVLEKYFLTPAKEGFTFEERLKEGYEMLDMIAEDIDSIGKKDLKIQDYLKELAKEEGILGEEKKIKQNETIRKGR